MLKLENWVDLFKYSKELLDDDFNHGQQLVVKAKAKADEGQHVSTNLFFTKELHLIYR